MSSPAMADRSLIDELEEGRRRLLSEQSSRSLLESLRRRLQTLTTNLYILRWIPEQGEDLYDVLVDGTSVAHIELQRSGGGVTAFAVMPLDEYREMVRRFTKPEQRKFEVAVHLAAKT